MRQKKHQYMIDGQIKHYCWHRFPEHKLPWMHVPKRIRENHFSWQDMYTSILFQHPTRISKYKTVSKKSDTECVWYAFITKSHSRHSSQAETRNTEKARRHFRNSWDRTILSRLLQTDHRFANIPTFRLTQTLFIAEPTLQALVGGVTWKCFYIKGPSGESVYKKTPPPPVWPRISASVLGLIKKNMIVCLIWVTVVVAL